MQTVVIGDICDIHKSANYGKKANQTIHQMPSGQTRQMLEYKCHRAGMKIVLQNEAYTTQTCPACGKRHKPSGREYSCACGFQFHRDGVGAINLRRKYLGLRSVPVVGVMAPPIGLRFHAHTRCSSVFNSIEKPPSL
ncbi:zinc ribbon domain-containing protein [Thermosynechococcus sp. FA-CM-4201]